MSRDGELFSFGLVADPQYCALPVEGTRYYANSVAKLEAAVDAFNGQDLAFVATLGDLIDRGWESYEAILAPYARLRCPHRPLPGNHDFGVAPEHLGKVRARLGYPAGYYDFIVSGHRFVVIDGTEISLFANPPGSPARAEAEARLAAMKEAGAENAQTWNGGISATQFAWLEDRFAQARQLGERVIVLGHFPLYPEGPHILWDSRKVMELLCDHGALAYFCGHDHAGNYGARGGCHFVNLKGMVETERETAYSTVAVHEDRLELTGYGSEPSRIFTLPAAPG